jgi:hypothetical protein
MNAEIDFDPDRVTAKDLQLARTKAAISQKLQVIFSQRDEHSSLSGATEKSSGAISTRTFGKIRGYTESATR